MNQSISSLSEYEKNSGKIWTLLSYSKAFQKDVKWLSAKYKTATNKRAKQATRENAKCAHGFTVLDYLQHDNKKWVSDGKDLKEEIIKLLRKNGAKLEAFKNAGN